MKQRSETISGLMLIILLLFPLSAHAQGTDAESVLKAREAALVGRDLDPILTLFADDANRSYLKWPSTYRQGADKGMGTGSG
jgi:hypothetical protein